MANGHDHGHGHSHDPRRVGEVSPVLIRAMNWSVGVGVLLLGVKVLAAWLTGSTALYADAAESVVHVLATLFAAFALRLARKPADDTHHFGHDKAAYLSNGLEGAMVAATALLVGARAVADFFQGHEVGRLGTGALLGLGTIVVNGVLGTTLLALGRRHGDRVVRANGIHVLADVWTTGAGVVALGLVAWTGRSGWDPVIALAFSGWVLWQGLGLVREATHGLMDRADPAVEERLRQRLTALRGEAEFEWHRLRHRHSGHNHWVELHLVFPEDTGLEHAHRRATEIEAALAGELGEGAQIITHLEPRSAIGCDQAWETPPGKGAEGRGVDD